MISPEPAEGLGPLQAKHGIGAHLLGLEQDDLKSFRPQFGNHGALVRLPCDGSAIPLTPKFSHGIPNCPARSFKTPGAVLRRTSGASPGARASGVGSGRIGRISLELHEQA